MNAIETIKDNVKIRDVVEHYGLQINYAGFICCPFHKEKTPSMKLYPERAKCFGCGESYDVIGFVQGMNSTDIKGAIEYLDNVFQLGLGKPLSREEKAKIRKRERERKDNIAREKRIKENVTVVSDKLLQLKRLYETAYFSAAVKFLVNDEKAVLAISYARKIIELENIYFYINDFPVERPEYIEFYISKKSLTDIYNKGHFDIKREDIFLIAQVAKKHDHRIYLFFKKLMDEKLSPIEVERFHSKLADILKI